MSYHEYDDGSIRHYNGHNLHFQAQASALELIPNSEYWHTLSMGVARRLADRLGYDAYCTWLDSQPEPESWHGLYILLSQHETELDEAQNA